eukprot:4650920-Pyramimonas_sp.AAC.1
MACSSFGRVAGPPAARAQARARPFPRRRGRDRLGARPGALGRFFFQLPKARGGPPPRAPPQTRQDGRAHCPCQQHKKLIPGGGHCSGTGHGAARA